jgi:YVTN family beta-propeller protein
MGNVMKKRMRRFLCGLAFCLPVAGGATAAPAQTLSGTLIVLNKAEASASLLDCASGEERLKLPTGDGPHEVAISPDGKAAVVANYGDREPGHTLTVIDLPAKRVVKTIELGYHRPHGVQFLPDGKRLAVTAEGEQVVVLVDVEAGSVSGSIRTDQQVSHMLVLGPEARRIYVANIRSGNMSVIDVEQGKAIATIETGRGAEGIDIAPDGSEVWVSNRAVDTVSIVDTEKLEVVSTLPCAAFPIRVKFTPDGKHVLVSNARSGDVAVFDAAKRSEVRRIAMQAESVDDTSGRLFQDRFGRGPVPVGILIEPKGTLAFVANTNADVVTVIDLATWKIAGRLTAGKEPDGLGYSPVVLGKGDE